MRPESRSRIGLRTATCRPGNTVLSPETEPHARFAPTLRSPRRLFSTAIGTPPRQTLRELFALNRRLAKAYLLKEQLAQLWTYTYEGAARRFLATWLRALRWQRLPAFQKLGRLLTRHVEGLLNYCHEKVPFGVVEAINGNLRAM